MSNLLKKISTKNFRCLADLSIEVGPLNVFFGPNGVGKSAFLDTIWFVRDCAVRGVETASSERNHGIGILWDGAQEGDPISITLETSEVRYELSFLLTSGRIDPYPGERLTSLRRNLDCVSRTTGKDEAKFYHVGLKGTVLAPLRDPDKLSLTRYLDFEGSFQEVDDFDRLLHFVNFYHSRSLALSWIKRRGSETGSEFKLRSDGANLWSVLRNLRDKERLDDRFKTIKFFMQRGLPTFVDLYFEQVGASLVYGSFIEKDRREPIQASGVSDGHLQLLILLTALFSEGRSRDSLILFDEPEVSLHPWALAVFAEAVKLATKDWNKQVFITTHSPVLLSQFEVTDSFSTELQSGRTQMSRVSEIKGIEDLLDQYATGSLYMAELLAPQSKLSDVQEEPLHG
jgi:predicted ATPase